MVKIKQEIKNAKKIITSQMEQQSNDIQINY